MLSCSSIISHSKTSLKIELAKNVEVMQYTESLDIFIKLPSWGG